MLGQRLRRWANTGPALAKHLVFANSTIMHHLQEWSFTIKSGDAPLRKYKVSIPCLVNCGSPSLTPATRSPNNGPPSSVQNTVQ